MLRGRCFVDYNNKFILVFISGVIALRLFGYEKHRLIDK